MSASVQGVVYRARDTKLGRDVAIKVLPEDISHDAERLSRFEREARLLASLNHPNVATLHGFEEASDKMMTVPVETDSELILGRPTMLFERRRNPDLPVYAVTPDGQRFIFLDDSVAEPAPTHLVLVQNFSEELNRLAPARN
jgi:serine/threonine protein kinase